VIDQGYPLEEHFVTTSDGYVLGLFRIPRGATDAAAAPGPSSGGSRGSGSSSSSSSASSSNPSSTCRPPVLLLHGVLDSSAAWVLNRPEQSLGFILADAGYDVWLGGWVGAREHYTWCSAVLAMCPSLWQRSGDALIIWLDASAPHCAILRPALLTSPRSQQATAAATPSAATTRGWTQPSKPSGTSPGTKWRPMMCLLWSLTSWPPPAVSAACLSFSCS